MQNRQPLAAKCQHPEFFTHDNRGSEISKDLFHVCSKNDSNKHNRYGLVIKKPGHLVRNLKIRACFFRIVIQIYNI